jgi:penicillin amidase
MPKVRLPEAVRIARPCLPEKIVLLIAMLLAAVAAHAGQEREIPSESITLPHLQQPVYILVDRWGVPHIYAKNEADLFYVQGFYVARLRLFQIDLWRRRGLGQLAEVFGPAYVEQDKATRLFLYRGDMKKEWEVYGPGTEQMFQRFVAGINGYIDWLDEHPEQMPFEFKHLHYRPARWTAEDAIRIRSHSYLYNLASEVARARVACSSDLKWDEFRMKLEPPWETRIPEGLDPCLPIDVLKVYNLATQPVRFTSESLTNATNQDSRSSANDWASEIPAESNNWVIAAKKSATGHAVLSSDPHLEYTEPSFRYLLDLNAPTLHVIGAASPNRQGCRWDTTIGPRLGLPVSPSMKKTCMCMT